MESLSRAPNISKGLSCRSQKQRAPLPLVLVLVSVEAPVKSSTASRRCASAGCEYRSVVSIRL